MFHCQSRTLNLRVEEEMEFPSGLLRICYRVESVLSSPGQPLTFPFSNPTPTLALLRSPFFVCTAPHLLRVYLWVLEDGNCPGAAVKRKKNNDEGTGADWSRVTTGQDQTEIRCLKNCMYSFKVQGNLREYLRYFPTPIHTLTLFISPPFSLEHTCSTSLFCLPPVLHTPSPHPSLALPAFLLSLFHILSPHFSSPPSPSVMHLSCLSVQFLLIFFLLQILLQGGR